MDKLEEKIRQLIFSETANSDEATALRLALDCIENLAEEFRMRLYELED